MECLTAGFGMGPGVSAPPLAPGSYMPLCFKAYKGFMRLRPRRISTGRLKGRYPLTLPAYLSGRLPDALLPVTESGISSRGRLPA